jgi:hypothetical protein
MRRIFYLWKLLMAVNGCGQEEHSLIFFCSFVPRGLDCTGFRVKGLVIFGFKDQGLKIRV